MNKEQEEHAAWFRPTSSCVEGLSLHIEESFPALCVIFTVQRILYSVVVLVECANTARN